MAETIRLEDELTINDVADKRLSILSALGSSGSTLIDAGHVERVDVAGIQLLIAAHKECRKRGVSMTFNPSRQTEELQALIGLRI